MEINNRSGIFFIFINTLSGGPQKDADLALKRNDFNDALTLIRPAVELGEMWAESDLGIMYLSGEGLPIDYTKAFKYFLLAAEQSLSVNIDVT